MYAAEGTATCRSGLNLGRSEAELVCYRTLVSCSGAYLCINAPCQSYLLFT